MLQIVIVTPGFAKITEKRSLHSRVCLVVRRVAGWLLVPSILANSAVGTTIASAASATAVPAISRQSGQETLPAMCRPTGDKLSVIRRKERSDWINVMTDVTPSAKGDGITDDTTPIQAALNRIGPEPGDPKVVYFPPGRYRITHTLVLKELNGGMLIGHGRGTVLIWDGRTGGRMFWSNGAARQSYIGLSWDGNGRASVGIDHHSTTLYETRVLHEQMEFHNFLEAGIRVGHEQKLASAEMLFRDIEFSNNRYGVLIQSWNDYNNVFEGCHFRNNSYGIYANKGNVVIHDSRFENSRESDLFLGTHSHSVRRVVSTGSGSFIRTVRGPAAGGLIQVDNCRIDGWHDSKGAIQSSLRGPLTLFDVQFTSPPGKGSPVQLTNPRYMKQVAILSNVHSNSTDTLIDKGPNGKIYVITGRDNMVPLVNLQQRFLRQPLPPPETILDVKENCGALGDGRHDDSAALQKCLDMARSAGSGTVMYFPSGTYIVTRTLRTLAGARYQVEGTGWHSRLVWKGRPDGTLLLVENPQGLKVTHLALGGRPGTVTLRQIGSAPSLVRYHNVFGYHSDETTDNRIRFDDLPAGTVVVADHLDGRITLHNSASATVLLGFLISTQLLVEGGSGYDGFLGVLSRVSALERFPLVVRDNQSLVMTDWYNEQSGHLMKLSGGAGARGRIIIGHTQAASSHPIFSHIDNYHGIVVETGGMFGRPAIDAPHRIDASGSPDLDIVLFGNMFWYRPPLPSRKGTRMTLLGNLLSKRYFGSLSLVGDMGLARGMPLIELAFNAFRELGRYDLALNYCAGRTPE